jgi:hypothetical protein
MCCEGLKKWLAKLAHSEAAHNGLTEHIERIDSRNREVRHDLNNVRATTSALQRLVESMREEETRHFGHVPSKNEQGHR